MDRDELMSFRRVLISMLKLTEDLLSIPPEKKSLATKEEKVLRKAQHASNGYER